MAPSPSIVQDRLSYWKLRAEETRSHADITGAMKRSQWWELEYFEAPYLAFASDEYLHQRFVDHFHNNMRLNSEGKIVPAEILGGYGDLLFPLFTHMNLEFGIRGGTPSKTIAAAKAAFEKYFDNGLAKGISLFAGRPETLSGVVVKFSKARFLEVALKTGEIRLTPATFYSNATLNHAMRDTETEREYHIPAFRDSLEGRSTTLFRDYELPIEDGFLKITKSCPEYLLWSGCQDIDRRLADDFDADAALIIKEPDEFAYRVRVALDSIWPSCPVWYGPVKYYDPCAASARLERPEQIKHFSYLYQREWRLCGFPNNVPKEPITLRIGSLDDIAELVTL